MIAEKYLECIQGRGIDTVVLGCTHYPLLKKVIAGVMEEGVKLIDSAIETSREIRMVLEVLDLKSEEEGGSSREFYVTDSPERFVRVGEQFLGRRIEHIEKIVLGG